MGGKHKEKTEKDEDDIPYKSYTKVPMFDGTPEKYQYWLLKLRAHARKMGFEAAIGVEKEKELPDKQEADASTATAQKAAIKRNDLAIDALTQAFEEAKLMDMILLASCKKWPTGQAWKVMKQLAEEYSPMDHVAEGGMLVELLSNVTMKEDDDPKVLFTGIRMLELKYSSVATAGMKQAVLSTQLPQEYQTTLNDWSTQKATIGQLQDERDMLLRKSTSCGS